jgi:hypothetical protein
MNFCLGIFWPQSWQLRVILASACTSQKGWESIVLSVIYAKWGKEPVWRETLRNKLVHVEWLMSAGWWKLTGCQAWLLSFYLN